MEYQAAGDWDVVWSNFLGVGIAGRCLAAHHPDVVWSNFLGVGISW